MRATWQTIRNPYLALTARLAIGGVAALVLLQTAPMLMPATDEAASAMTVTPAPAGPLAERLAAIDPDPTATLSTIRVTRELDIPHWLGPGEWVWNAEGAPAQGETIIVVNLRARVISVYRAGHEIGRSSLIYGAGENPTPHGTFPILEKDADHVSNIYDGAPMPHMLRLTMDGVAIHGSPELADDLATHGCVGLPREFAAQLFGAVRVGDRVVIWDGETSA